MEQVRSKKILLVSNSRSQEVIKNLPGGAKYIKQCLKDFLDLGLEQDLEMPGPSAQGEPLWYNNRFSTGLNKL